MKHLSFREAERLMVEACRDGFVQVLDMQEQVNVVACREGKPCIDLVNEEEHQRILDLMAWNTWRYGCTSGEVRSDVLLGWILAEGHTSFAFPKSSGRMKNAIMDALIV